jgi:hypothetical protein
VGHTLTSRGTDDTLEVEVWERALRPSDAVTRANRRLTDLWPKVRGYTRSIAIDG